MQLTLPFSDPSQQPVLDTHTIKFADFCAGIGGFRLGLERTGMQCVFSCEVDQHCAETYSANFGRGFDARDVMDLDPKRVPQIDMLCAGFPCQPFSVAGNRMGWNDRRSNIFFKLAEILREKQPRVVLFENVPNLLRVSGGAVLKEIVATVGDLGYVTHYGVLNSADFGVPQRRPRLYIVGFRGSEGFRFSLTPRTKEHRPVREALIPGDNSIPISDKWHYYIDLYTGKKTLAQSPFDIPKTRFALERCDPGVNLENCIFQMRSSGIRALSVDRPIATLAVSVSGGGPMIPVYSKERRHLSIREMARIMGFPDSYVFPVRKTYAIKQLANAVCPDVIASIGSDIIRCLAGVDASDQRYPLLLAR